jgi:hypothetical protein
MLLYEITVVLWRATSIIEKVSSSIRLIMKHILKVDGGVGAQLEAVLSLTLDERSCSALIPGRVCPE